jgi:hypothetical protein
MSASYGRTMRRGPVRTRLDSVFVPTAFDRTESGGIREGVHRRQSGNKDSTGQAYGCCLRPATLERRVKAT